MMQLVLIAHIIIAISLITLVLVQQGKGAGIGVSFGSGASSTVFGSKGSAGFLFKITAFLAIAFFVTSLGLTYIASHQISRDKSDDIPGLTIKVPTQVSAPTGENDQEGQSQ